MNRFLPLAAVMLLWPGRAAADPVHYLRDIKPILKQRCFDCHGALKQKSNLRLDAIALIRKGGRHGPAIVSGSAVSSRLIERVTDAEPSTRMPPEGQPLSDRQIGLLKAWIDQGAAAPADDKPEEDPREHWAFKRPVRPAVPMQAWGRNSIDAFLAQAHSNAGLVANAAADRATLLRRVYLDVIGLPPSREELHAFLSDSSADAYERVVDRLLDSPAYGERWARHWMDVWRYSDWYGRRSVPDVMNSYPQIWRWRDWIVKSLNEDKGYDRMILEMLAADEIAPTDEEALPATGFVVRNWFKWNYNQWMRDNVEHTGKAFLGLTINCCHCHDHKYDPITQEEYFRFRAFFEPLELRHDRVAGEPDPGPFEKYVYTKSYGPITSGRIRVFDEKLDAQTFFYTGGDERNRDPKKPPVTPAAPAALGGDRLRIEAVALPPEAWNPGLKPYVQREELAKHEAAVDAAMEKLAQARQARIGAERRLAEARDLAAGIRIVPPPVADVLARHPAAADEVRLAEARLVEARSALASIEARIAADQAVHVLTSAQTADVCRAASRSERQHQLDAALAALCQAENASAAAQRKPTVPAQRQALDKQLAAAKAKVADRCKELESESVSYTPISQVFPKTSTGRRTALARWIASHENPLTARVAVNHVWSWHFGRPLVETTFNFGRNGQRPSHPVLLDWLAVELMDNGWRMKSLHRMILTSEAYRMSSRALETNANRKTDPDNRLLWHFPVARMEAEVVRDSLLHAAGDLDLTIGGPEIAQSEGLASRRRSIYFAHHGEGRMEFLNLFDAANPCDAYGRTTSVLPQQALALSNSELALRQSRTVARRLSLEVANDAAFIQAAFEQVLGRWPLPAEQEAATAFLGRQVRLFDSASAEIKSTRHDSYGPAIEPAARARENLIHALFNHNDFVTIR